MNIEGVQNDIMIILNDESCFALMAWLCLNACDDVGLPGEQITVGFALPFSQSELAGCTVLSGSFGDISNSL